MKYCWLRIKEDCKLIVEVIVSKEREQKIIFWSFFCFYAIFSLLMYLKYKDNFINMSFIWNVCIFHVLIFFTGNIPFIIMEIIAFNVYYNKKYTSEKKTPLIFNVILFCFVTGITLSNGMKLKRRRIKSCEPLWIF
jgi:hypothetical protein